MSSTFFLNRLVLFKSHFSPLDEKAFQSSDYSVSHIHINLQPIQIRFSAANIVLLFALIILHMLGFGKKKLSIPCLQPI